MNEKSTFSWKDKLTIQGLLKSKSQSRYDNMSRTGSRNQPMPAFELSSLLSLQKEANAQIDRMITLGGRKKKKEEEPEVALSTINKLDADSYSQRSRRSSQASARLNLGSHNRQGSRAQLQLGRSNSRQTPLKDRDRTPNLASQKNSARNQQSAGPSTGSQPGLKQSQTFKRREGDRSTGSPELRAVPSRHQTSVSILQNNPGRKVSSTAQLGVYKFEGKRYQELNRQHTERSSRLGSPRGGGSPDHSNTLGGASIGRRDSLKVSMDNAIVLQALREEGNNVDAIAKNLTLQRQISDALHEYQDEVETHNRKRKNRYWSERDEHFGPGHPLKAKYRKLNSQATRLFIKSRMDNLFFDQYQKQEIVKERSDAFYEQLLVIFKRCKKTQSVSPDLIEHLKTLNT